MTELNLEARGNEQQIIKQYLEENASEILADKINNGAKIEKDGKTLINKKTLDGFMKYATSEAKKQAEKGATSACVRSDVVFGWAIHYFEEKSIEEKDAVTIAKNFLSKIGYSSMTESYYYVTDDICTINFAYISDDIICYADLIKVSVSLDKGKITSVDCSGYLMNHKARKIPENISDVSAAEKNISTNLEIRDYKKAFIPMDDGSEIFTYEFLCNDKDNNDVLVYINALTLNEADIKLLLYSDSGTLTR